MKSSDAAHSEHRTSQRITTDIQAIVQFKQDSGESWKEVTNLSSISKSGCSFILTHPCPTGRLVKMVTPLPAEFRAYDLTAELYPVIGLVQHCYESSSEGETAYRLGVAFVGKSFPESYKANPLQNYYISGTTDSGLWKITESGKTFHVRNSPRFWISLPISLTLIQKEKRSHAKEDTVTTNISSTGASVLSSLRIRVGDRVKFASKKHDFYTMAVVRNSRNREGKYATVHLEFMDQRFPIEQLSVKRVTAVTAGDENPSDRPGTPGSHVPAA